MGYRITKMALAVIIGSGMAGVAAATGAVPAGAATSTAFAITVDGGTSSSISTSVDATLAESGLPSDATGTVDFTQGVTTLCTATLPATSCTTSGLGAGSYTGITAAYSGDATYYPSTSDNSVDLTVTADTSFTIAVNDSTSAVIPTSADATLSETGLPGPATGTVEFDQGGSILCTATLPDTSCTTSGLPADSYTGITATYSGGGSYSGSTSTNSVDLTVADSTLTCTKVAGFATSVKKVQFAKCGTSQKGAWINGSSYTTGGTATWATSKATFTYAVTTTSPGRGSCPAGRIEQDASGLVLSADANAVVQVGDYVGFSVCENTTTHVVKLLPGTSASL